MFEAVKVSGRHQLHFGQRKETKKTTLNCCNMNCFKMEYQLVKSIIQTLF